MYEMNDGAFDELELFADQEGVFGDQLEGDFESLELEADFEAGDDFELEAEGDDEELELAAELLALGDDQELEQFFGKLIRGATRRARGFFRSRTGRALSGLLRQGARRALPMVGRAIAGPAGGRLASSAGRIFGLELEGLSPEDQELEMARRFVRLGRDASRRAARIPAGMHPTAAARQALAAAASRHAPGMLAGRSRSPLGGGQSGRWVRRGQRIVLLGV